MIPDLSHHLVELIQIEVGNKLQNYIYLLRDEQTQITACIDPTEADIVLEALKRRGWELHYILTTHHHHDHVGGNQKLKEATNCQVLGFEGDAKRIPEIDIKVEEGQRITIGNQQAEILFIPGHTLGHIAYYFGSLNLLFSGDTLFAMGCGRLFEGTAGQLYNSLSKLATLPEETVICCAHEYTQTNAAFALTVDPYKEALIERQRTVEDLRKQGHPTVPMTLAEEKATNPFLRTHDSAIREQLAMESATNTEVLAELRRRKDNFSF